MKHVVIVWVLFALSSVVLGAERETTENDDGERQKLQEKQILRASAAAVEDLRALAVDLAGFYAEKYLEDRLMVLSTEGAQVVGSTEVDTGALWIRKVETRQTAENQLNLQLEAIGWRWVDKEQEAAGATFGINENIKFSMTLSATGTFDLTYDPKTHVLTLYFIPVEPAKATFDLTAGLDVETESLWASIVGVAAAVTGEALETRTGEAIGKRGRRTIRSKLDAGFTIILDLCTSQSYVKFGTYPEGKVPPSALPSGGGLYAVNSVARLYEDSLLMVGPFEKEEAVYATFTNTSGLPFAASWVCKSNAAAYAGNYVKGEQISEISALKTHVIPPGQEEVVFEPPETLQCPLVLLMRPTDEEKLPVQFSYAVIFRDKNKQPLVKCDKNETGSD